MQEMDAFITQNVARALEAVNEAEVLVLGFWMFSERLLVDFRSSAEDPPLIRVVPQVQSAQQRLRELRVLRPRFESPRRFYFFVWPRSLRVLDGRGVWPRLVDRCAQSGHPKVADDAALAWNVLEELERRHLAAAVTGQGYRTEWQRR